MYNPIRIRSKRAQIFIFIAIAIVIVGGIALYLILKPSINNASANSGNLNEYMQKCASDATLQALKIMLPQGGKITPENYILYNGEKIEYLCYNSNWYFPCVNQQPLFIEHLQDEIKGFISPRINSCFESAKSDLEKQNYKVNMIGENLSVNLYPKKVVVSIGKSVDLSKGGEKKRYDNFSAIVSSPLYELANTVMDIANGEARDCQFDYSTYERNYPSINIDRVFTENNTQIYTLQDELNFKFAVRSCALPGAF